MIRVLIVDDSAVVRRLLTEELAKIDDIEVVGTAVDPYAARAKIAELEPDVITLDLEMPRMDGLSFLEKIMRYHPLPVVIVSSVTPEGSEPALTALALGAIDVVPKPGSQFTIPDVRRRLARAIRAAAVSKPAALTDSNPGLAKRLSFQSVRTTQSMIAIGASTGGTQALEHVLRMMPADSPGIVVVQHMPGGFTRSFAERLDGVCAMEVQEAKAGDRVVPGLCLIAEGSKHIMVRRSGVEITIRVKDGPAVNFHKPSVDVLMQSVASEVGANAVGAILTGMGGDGAQGLLAMREAGAPTIAQDERTSVVFGMPKVAIELGAAIEVVPLQEMADALLANSARETAAVHSA